MKKINYFVVLFGLLIAFTAEAQKNQHKLTDAASPLHLMQPQYSVPYGIPEIKDIKSDLDRILTYLDEVTPAQVVNNKTGKEITDTTSFDQNVSIKKGDFRIASYEWGVTYSAMLSAAEITNDSRYAKYVNDRFRFFARMNPIFKKLYDNYGQVDPVMQQMIKPKALDDAGAMCAAMIKAQRKDQNLNLRPIIDNYINYIMYGEYRLF
ncbi:MAG TPA: glycosyl hydrolase, partial [Bacteroidales bacterium]|nr:glycosyl hydrolase [Bacteroidales bacterium]